MNWKEDETLLNIVGPTTMDDLEEFGYIIVKKTTLEPDDEVFVLLGEYEDQDTDSAGYHCYYRAMNGIAASKSEEVLEGYKSTIQDTAYIDFLIEEVPLIGWVKEE